MLKLLIVVFPIMLFAQNLTEWKTELDYSSHLKLNDLRFSNRARCALDSKLPTKSAFLLIDNVNPAKALHRFAQDAGLETKEEIRNGVEKFRYTANKLLEIISTKLLNGELPLLNGDDVISASKSCDDKNNCRDLYNLVEHYWINKDEGKSYLPKTIRNNTSNYSCYYLKKFSPVQAHLYGVKPDVTAMNAVGKATSEHQDYLASCSDIASQKNLKVANFQIDLLGLDDKVWKSYGFEFWTSLKIYFSWAYRYSNEAVQLMFPYENILRSVAIEENVIFVPNGCKSIEKPSCDAKTLSMNNMRLFARSTNQEAVFGTDMLRQIPQGPEADLLTTPITDVNVDILNLGKFEDANEWSENFRNNFTKARGFVKLKFTKAVNNINFITANLSEEQIVEDFNKDVEKLGKVSAEEETLIKNEFYYLCSEYYIASSEKFSFLKEDLDILKENSALNNFILSLSKENIPSLFESYTKIAEKINKVCDRLQTNKLWIDGYVVPKDGFHSWYKEYTLAKPFPHKTRTVNDLIKHRKPLLAYKQYEKSKRKGNVICMNGANCARLLLDSIIDIYAIVQYSNSLLPLNSSVQSPAMFNPMSERRSCKVYDPWRKTRQTIFGFFHDTAQAAFFGLLPSPVYVAAGFKPNEVVSFNTLVKEGRIQYDPKFKKNKVDLALIADFGNLLGIPCNISIAGSEFNPGRYYAFTGISVGSCIDRANHNLTVMGPGEMSSSERARSACFSCAINLRSAAFVASKFNPITRIGYFLARGFYNLYKNLRDPNDIPRSWEVKVNNASLAYRRFGEISKKCTRKLRRGKSCMKNSCEQKILERISERFSSAIFSANTSKLSRRVNFKVKGCDELITLNTRGKKKGFCNGQKPKLSDFTIPESCQSFTKREL